jgi:DNA-directed RNA polymerase subunit beta
LKEIQSLSLDANVVSEGSDVEISDEEDDLLKAAEELGMDLTGVRADNGPDGNGLSTPEASDEQEEQVIAEGEGGTDAESADAVPEAEPAEVED